MEKADSGLESGLGLYIHIPFCPQHCPYCAFAVVTGHRHLYTRYVDAVCVELHQWRQMAAGPLQTVFVGGGTPSMLSPDQVRQILEAAAYELGVAPGAEITLEANPGTVDAAKFAALRQVGVNRLSLGIQALNDTDLHVLGRLHDADEARASFRAARQAGFDNINIDLMFSIPGTPRAHWRQTVDSVLAMLPEHISAYGLTIEAGTRFSQRYHQGRLKPVSESYDRWAYDWVVEQLGRAGYEHYEVSNFARRHYRSRHNWGYWYGVPYIGVGLSAHSFVGRQRLWNTRDIQTYLNAVEAGRSPGEGQEELDDSTARVEQIFMRLRTSNGVQLEDLELDSLREQPKFQAMLGEQLIHLEGGRLYLTPHGFRLADAITVELLDMVETAKPIGK